MTFIYLWSSYLIALMHENELYDKQLKPWYWYHFSIIYKSNRTRNFFSLMKCPIHAIKKARRVGFFVWCKNCSLSNKNIYYFSSWLFDLLSLTLSLTLILTQILSSNSVSDSKSDSYCDSLTSEAKKQRSVIWRMISFFKISIFLVASLIGLTVGCWGRR